MNKKVKKGCGCLLGAVLLLAIAGAVTLYVLRPKWHDEYGERYKDIAYGSLKNNTYDLYLPHDAASKDCQAIQMLGHSMNAVSIPKGGELVYHFTNQREGEATLYTAMIPTQPNDKGDLRYQVTLDNQGIPCYEIREGVAWDNIPYTPEMEEIAKSCKAVCWGSLAQRSIVTRTTIQKFLDATPADCVKIFDINLRQKFYSKEVIEESFKKCNILKINDEELVVIERMFNLGGLDLEKQCHYLIDTYKLNILVLTCGTNGSYVFTADKKSFQPTPKVKVADTVGAGDSFTGSFCAAVLKGKPIEEAHKLAVEVSAYICTQNGAMPILPESILQQF